MYRVDGQVLLASLIWGGPQDHQEMAASFRQHLAREGGEASLNREGIRPGRIASVRQGIEKPGLPGKKGLATAQDQLI
jgi:hypothetical protein